MPTCQYQKNGERCSIETDTEKDTYCYVHNCIENEEVIINKDKFISFLESHITFFDKEIPKYEILKIGFDFNINEIASKILKSLHRARPLFFINTCFLEKAIFEDFNRLVLFKFINCDFKKGCSFKKCRFCAEQNITKVKHFFQKVSFLEESDFSKSELNNVEFKDTDLSKCIFYKAEFKNCNFVNVKWAKIGKIFGRKHAFLDETLLNYKNENYIEKLSDLENTYRSLKALAKNAEDRDMEGGFNYSENEMIRKRTKRYKQLFTSKFWFFLVSRYGERPSWAFLNIFFIIFIFSFFYLFSGVGIINSTENVNFHTINLSNWPYLIAHAFSPVTLNKWQLTTTPNLYTYFISIFEGGFLATQIGLFVMSFRRKFQR